MVHFGLALHATTRAHWQTHWMCPFHWLDLPASPIHLSLQGTAIAPGGLQVTAPRCLGLFCRIPSNHLQRVQSQEALRAGRLAVCLPIPLIINHQQSQHWNTRGCHRGSVRMGRATDPNKRPGPGPAIVREPLGRRSQVLSVSRLSQEPNSRNRNLS